LPATGLTPRPESGLECVRLRAGRHVRSDTIMHSHQITTHRATTPPMPSLAYRTPPPLQRRSVSLCEHRLPAAEGARRAGVGGERGCFAHAAGGRRASVVVGLGRWRSGPGELEALRERAPFSLRTPGGILCILVCPTPGPGGYLELTRCPPAPGPRYF